MAEHGLVPGMCRASTVPTESLIEPDRSNAHRTLYTAGNPSRHDLADSQEANDRGIDAVAATDSAALAPGATLPVATANC